MTNMGELCENPQIARGAHLQRLTAIRVRHSLTVNSASKAALRHRATVRPPRGVGQKATSTTKDRPENQV